MDDRPEALCTWGDVDHEERVDLLEEEEQELGAFRAGREVLQASMAEQVAALAAQHFLVEKTVEGGRTISSLQQVDGEARVEELMRMLGGQSEEARSMARSLLSAV